MNVVGQEGMPGRWKQIFLDVFKRGLGTMKGIVGKMVIYSDARPTFWKARIVTNAMKEWVNYELERLLKEGIIESVNHSDCETPIVPILKKYSSIRICGDYKITINKVAKIDSYPIPRIEYIYAQLAGGKIFITIDLSNAYLKMHFMNNLRY